MIRLALILALLVPQDGAKPRYGAEKGAKLVGVAAPVGDASVVVAVVSAIVCRPAKKLWSTSAEKLGTRSPLRQITLTGNGACSGLV